MTVSGSEDSSAFTVLGLRLDSFERMFDSMGSILSLFS